MSSSTLLLFLSLFTVSVLAAAVPAQLEGDSPLAIRQSAPMCVNDSDCYSEPVPVVLAQCLSNGICSCQECFSQNSSSNMCYQEYPTCYFYDASIGQCQDERPSQLVAFILSLSLSGVGAANFYIGRNDLGGAQLALLLSLFAIIYCMIYTMCCLACCMGMEKGEIFGGVAMFIVTGLAILLIVGVSFSMTAWWIADAVIFGTNDRIAGNGCPLQPDL